MAIYNNEKDQNVIDSEKKCYTIYATIRIEIETDLHITDAIDEFQNDCLSFILFSNNIQSVKYLLGANRCKF